MTREERAKQFMPFDAMKGLQKALREREERHSRVEKRELSDEIYEKNSKVLLKVQKGMKVELYYFHAFHNKRKVGTVTKVDRIYKYLKLEEEKIFFDDIYAIRIIDV